MYQNYYQSYSDGLLSYLDTLKYLRSNQDNERPIEYIKIDRDSYWMLSTKLWRSRA